ncbi:MAG: hypothetical protein H0U73_05230 [Tatlockia sp.]|nr:hypothetical protein [Tatlockia sp.]
MLKKVLKPFIIVLIQAFVLVTFVGCLTPFLLKNTASITHYRQFLQHFKGSFLIIHGIFYCLLYCLWPLLIKLLCRKQTTPPSAEQLHRALNARIYLIAAFLIIESLNCLR